MGDNLLHHIFLPILEWSVQNGTKQLERDWWTMENKSFFTGRQFSLLTYWQLLLATMAINKKLSNIDENQNENYFLAKGNELARILK